MGFAVSRGLCRYGYSGEALWSIPSIYVSTDMEVQVCSPEFGVSKAVSNHMLVYSNEAQYEVPVGEGSFYYT